MQRLALVTLALGLVHGQTLELRVNPAAGRHPISRDIYGLNEMGDADGNGKDVSLIGKLPFTARRWGGDSSVGYNWQLDANNTAANWYFETFPMNRLKDATADALGLTTGSSFAQWAQRNQKAGIKSVATVPIIGWTVNSNRPKQCSFSVAKYGAQKATDIYAPDCGTGVKPDGKTNIENDPNDAYMPVGPDFAQQWVAATVERLGRADQGGIALWELDNEPTWWHAVHRHIHPQLATFDEMLDRNIRWAQAIKSADPKAQVGGPTPPGWESYFYSAADLYAGWSTGPDYKYWNNPKDCKAHFEDGVCGFFLPWYLRQMKKYEDDNGVRLLDYLDIHGYVTPDGLPATADPKKPDIERLRLTATRLLWDPEYMPATADIQGMDRKWGTGKPQLIRRMKTWIDANYPGTKLALTEYNWGAQESITGALVQADLFGIFGREGVDLATIWGNPRPEQPAAFAWRMFLDYDGTGSGFGDTSVEAISPDWDRLSIFAAERASTKDLTLILLNKSPEAASPLVRIASNLDTDSASLPYQLTVERWEYSTADLTRIVRRDDAVLLDGAIPLDLPGYSLTLLVLHPLPAPPPVQ